MLHTSRLASSFLLSLTFVGLAACNSVETGAYGVVEFTPDECGRAWCDFDDRLALGATTNVELDGVNGQYVDDLHIETSAYFIAEVIAEDFTFGPEATIEGTGIGFVDLLAVDDWGDVVDYLEIEVAAPDALGVAVVGSSIDGPHVAADVDDLYFVAPNTRVSIDVSPYADGSELTGKLGYSVFLDQDMFAAVEPGDDIASGKFDFMAPVGEHTITIVTTTASRTVHFSVK
jgi:hypothetical protein